MARPWTGNGQLCSAINCNNRRKRAQHCRSFVFPSNCCACSDSLFGGGAIGIVNDVFKLILLVTLLAQIALHAVIVYLVVVQWAL